MGIFKNVLVLLGILDKCPKCGSTNVTKEKVSEKKTGTNPLKEGPQVIGRVETYEVTYKFTCHDCKYKWKDTKTKTKRIDIET